MASPRHLRDLVIVAALVVAPFFFLRASLRHPDQLTGLDRSVLRLSGLIELGITRLTRGAVSTWSDYVWLVDVQRHNADLKAENAQLRASLHEAERAAVENIELRRLVQLKRNVDAESLSAQVVAKDFSPFFRVVRVVIDRGVPDLRPHMPVVGTDGVVGAILRVSGDTADVQLAVDAAFGVDVEDERTHARGFVRGTGDVARYLAKVEMVDARDDVAVGDLLVTSGKGRWFPRGLPVARITKVVKREIGREQEVEAEPTVDFSRLEHVLVLLDATPNVGPEKPAGKRGAER
jgi:rod shape-determining protein MreC